MAVSKYEKMFGTWAPVMEPFLVTPAFKAIGKKLVDLRAEGKTIYPLFDDTFRAFQLCPWDKLVAVIITTNPYTKLSDGLAFSCESVTFHTDRPPVLEKLLDGLEDDVCDGLLIQRGQDLSGWAKQGVLLLNLDLSVVNKDKPGASVDLWSPFIDYVVQIIQHLKKHVIFGLVGKQAWELTPLIDMKKFDTFLVEHPMSAVKDKRPWNHNELFSSINRISNLLNDREIKWCKEQREPMSAKKFLNQEISKLTIESALVPPVHHKKIKQF